MRIIGTLDAEPNAPYLKADYWGLVIHHTASNYGRDYKGLYDGRPDLAGPLCNTSGNDDGSITFIAAHPANHAGASVGWDTAPLPVTSLFNPLVSGHEIVYPGTSPMRPAQYQSATILARVVTEVLGVPMSQVKSHDGIDYRQVGPRLRTRTYSELPRQDH